MRFATALLVALLTISSALANGEGETRMPQCGSHDQVIAQLTEEYDEAVTASGVTVKGALLEVLESQDGMTWSIILTSPSGRTTCTVSTGEGWRMKHAMPGEDT